MDPQAYHTRPFCIRALKRIYEHSPPASNLTGTEHADYDKERETQEKRRDTELAAEIAQRKKATNERSIKLTAVLMASRKMLGAFQTSS